MARLAPDFNAITNEIYCILLQLQNCGVACQVYDYPPLQLNGATPIITMHDDGTIKKDYQQSWQVNYRVTIFINRAVDGSRAAEATLRSVRSALHRLLANNRRGTYYSALSEVIGSPSVPLFQVIDGQPYRQEEIMIAAHVEFCDIAKPFISIGQGGWLKASDCDLLRYTDRYSECGQCAEPTPAIKTAIKIKSSGARISLGGCNVLGYRGLYPLVSNENNKAISFGGADQIIEYKG